METYKGGNVYYNCMSETRGEWKQWVVEGGGTVNEGEERLTPKKRENIVSSVYKKTYTSTHTVIIFD